MTTSSSTSRTAVSCFDFALIFVLVQLYVPPRNMLTKDFLKQILTEEKKLVEIKEISMIKVPFFDELSVKNIWPKM